MPQNKSSPKRITDAAAVNLTSIEWMLSVADHQSIRGAARALGVRQSAVSRRVGSLENALGVSLFERSPRGVRMTNAGALFIEDAREALRRLQLASRMAAEAGRGGVGRLSIGIQPSIGAGFLRELIQLYSARHPGVAIKLLEGMPPSEHIALVRRRQLDLAFVVDTAEVGDCDIAQLWNERLFVVLPHGHPLGKLKVIRWSELGSEHFIFREAKCDPALCERVLQRLGDHPVIEKLDVGGETIMHLVGMGRGVSITSEATLGTPYPNVIFRPISGGDEEVQFSAVWLAENDNPALRRFLSLAKAQAKRNRRDARTTPLQSNSGGIILSLASLGALARSLGLST
jgi:DNA-binding transcriptional LysR family regulator